MIRGIERGFLYLQETQNTDGGWGYHAGKMSYSEPTSFAVIALSNDESYEENVQRGLAWLTNHQSEDGGWKVSANDDDTSWVTSLAVIALTVLDRNKASRDSGTLWLLNVHGHTLSGKIRIRLNTKARGWPYQKDTSSWVEPTAYATIALKLARDETIHPDSARRVQGAEAMFLDTMCVGGGWNYGNKRVLGVNLRPYLTTTTLTLIALQGCEGDERADECVRQSLNYVKSAVKTESSTFSLALSIICLDVYGEDTAPLCASLHELQSDNGSWEDNAYLTALALTALKTGEGINPFRIKRKVP